ncbi:hypothetical protein JNL27_08995 [bacterium]|nr:hypothetical protein [bacterium]
MKMLLCVLILISGTLAAQDRVSVVTKKPRVAVLPFEVGAVSDRQMFDQGGIEKFAESVTQQLVNTFVGLRRFIVVERSAIEKILKEQNLQTSDLTDPSKAVSLGAMLGTEFLVQGTIVNIHTTTSKKDKKSSCKVDLLIRIIDVTTGQIIASKDITGISDKKKDKSANIAYGALDNADAEISRSIKQVFPVEGKIIRFVEPETDKKAKKKDKSKKKQADLVLISCGKDLGIKEGDKFQVIQEEEIIVDGQIFKRQKAVGKLKVVKLEMDGIFSICEVIEGSKVISADKEKLDFLVVSIE